MATYERELRIRAPLSDVWAFHSTTDGLRTLTPDWMGLRVDAIQRSEGERDSQALAPGTRLRLSVTPFGIGPRQRWVSRIVDREKQDGYAHFSDVMETGPFPEWRHDHQFYGDGEETLVRDRVTYRAPAGRVGDCIASAFLEPMFRDRHRRTRDIFDSP